MSVSLAERYVRVSAGLAAKQRDPLVPKSSRLLNALTWMDKFGDWFIPEPNTGCWLWSRAVRNGYGVILFRGRQSVAHRVSYLLLRGPIPDGLQLDHLCRVRCCVNPAHLEAVTARENMLRGTGASARHSRQTHCIHGHEFTPDNTYYHPKRNNDRQVKRTCRKCRCEGLRRYRERHAA